MNDMRKVIVSKDRQREIIRDVHEGLGESAKAKALSSKINNRKDFKAILLA